jgi:spore maturation protein CgeB
MIKIIYLSPNMENYTGAFYQQDVIAEIKNQGECYLYGQNFSQYNPKDNIFDVIAKSGFRPDLIIIGHTWLDDAIKNNLEIHPNLSLSKCNTKKLFILNKEYSRLNEKLQWAKHSNVDVIYTHHHLAESYQERTGIKTVFWPFAVNPKRIKKNGKKEIDVAFSGILQNTNFMNIQSELRIKIFKKIYFSLFDIKIAKKNRFKNLNIVFNALPRKSFTRKIAIKLGQYRRYDEEEYFNLMAKTKIYINTLSPLGLVGTRYYENMASKALVFCEESDVYSKIFMDGTYITFKADLSDFEEKLSFLLENPQEVSIITERAYEHVMKKHTWRNRIKVLLEAC